MPILISYYVPLVAVARSPTTINEPCMLWQHDEVGFGPKGMIKRRSSSIISQFLVFDSAQQRFVAMSASSLDLVISFVTIFFHIPNSSDSWVVIFRVWESGSGAILFCRAPRPERNRNTGNLGSCEDESCNMSCGCTRSRGFHNVTARANHVKVEC